MTRDQFEAEVWEILLGRPRQRKRSRLLARQIAAICVAADRYATAEARVMSERAGILGRAAGLGAHGGGRAA